MPLSLSGDIAGLGKFVQVVRATDTTNRSTSSTSYADASISVTISPLKANSNILLVWSFLFEPASNQSASLQITDSSNVAISGAQEVTAQFGASTVPMYGQTLVGWASPATTSPVTYKGRFRATSGGTINIRNATTTGQLFAIEVAA